MPVSTKCKVGRHAQVAENLENEQNILLKIAECSRNQIVSKNYPNICLM